MKHLILIVLFMGCSSNPTGQTETDISIYDRNGISESDYMCAYLDDEEWQIQYTVTTEEECLESCLNTYPNDPLGCHPVTSLEGTI